MPSAVVSAGAAATAGMAGIIVGRICTAAVALALIWAAGMARVHTWVADTVALVPKWAGDRVVDDLAHTRAPTAADAAVAADMAVVDTAVVDTVIAAKSAATRRHYHVTRSPDHFRALLLFREPFGIRDSPRIHRWNRVAEMLR